MSSLEARVRAAHQRRVDRGVPSETEAYRWLHDEADDVAGVIADRYADVVIIKLRTATWWDQPERVAALVDALTAVAPVRVRVIVDEPNKHSVRALVDREAELQARIDAAEQGAPTTPWVCAEHGRRFEITGEAGFSQGIFLDMRTPRHDLAERWRGRRVANLFAYTCAFGVYLAGHNDVVNVDVSRRYLDWGQRNYALNGLEAPDGFVRKDAFAYLAQGNKMGVKWDAIVLDPPVFSRGKKGRSRRFSLKRDLDQLVVDALDALAPDGELFVSTNLAALEQDVFHARVRAVARAKGRRVLKRWDPAADYPVDRDRYHLKTALVG